MGTNRQPSTNSSKKSSSVSSSTCSIRPIERSSASRRRFDSSRPAAPCSAALPTRTTRSTGTGARKPISIAFGHVDGVGEAAGEVDPVDLVGGHAEPAQQDPLAAGVGGLGLGEQARVRAREGDALLGRDDELVEAVAEPALLVHPARAPELGQDVDEARAADPDRLDVADRLDARSPSPSSRTRLDRAVGAGHAEAQQAALEGRAGRARGGEEARAVGHHDLGVGADVDEHPDARAAREVDGDEVRRGVRRRRGWR